MRLSTIVFLLIFAGMFGHLHRFHGESFLNISTDEASCEHEQAAQINQLETELRTADQEFRRNKSSLSKLEGNIGRLQDLVRRAERDLAQSQHDSQHPVAMELRNQNLRRMQRNLEEVLHGRRSLQIAQECLEGECAATRAKLELAKAGLWHDENTELARVVAGPEPEPRPSPIDALSHLTIARD